MKLVTFAKAQPPGYGVGDTALVPDAVAKRLADEGVISASETWPKPAPRPARPTRQAATPTRPMGLPDQRKAS